MAARIIAIGDVHGCAAALRTLVENIDPCADDTIVMLGDCVDRGPDSHDVIELTLDLREKCQLKTIMGNHEEMMLNWIDGRPQPDDWLMHGGLETLSSYTLDGGKLALPSAHLEYIRTWTDYWECASHFFVHGSYDADQPLPNQNWQLLRWISLGHHVPAPHRSGKTAVVGHSSQKSGEILDLGHLQCIDTFCHGGGWLTAIEIHANTVWQANRLGALRTDN